MSRGNPVMTIRLDNPTIAALKMSARKHNTTVSELIRILIDMWLAQDDAKICEDQIPGQISVDEY